MPLFLGVAVLILLLWAAKAFSKADPKQAARLIRYMGGCGALIFATFLLFRGEIGVAIPVGVFGLGSLGWVSLWPASFAGRTLKSTRSCPAPALLSQWARHGRARCAGALLRAGVKAQIRRSIRQP